MFFLVFPGTDFVAFEELLHRVRLFPFRQVLDCLLVLLVVMDCHAEQAEMGRFLELAPEILDEVLEDARILVKFQERVFVPLICRDRFDFSVLADFADYLYAFLRVILVVDHHQLGDLFHRKNVRFNLRFSGPFRFFIHVLFLCHTSSF